MIGAIDSPKFFTMEKSNSQHNSTEVPEPGAEPIACRRCGVCCTKHQAFVEPEDIARIASYLGITMNDWERLYDDSAWRYSEYRLIRHVNGACAFLEYDNGVTACAIQAVKPDCCAGWQPGLDRRECREGMKKAAG